jgi:hypothetical protein
MDVAAAVALALASLGAGEQELASAASLFLLATFAAAVCIARSAEAQNDAWRAYGTGSSLQGSKGHGSNKSDCFRLRLRAPP